MVDPPEAIPPSRFTSSSPLASSPDRSFSSSEPRTGVSGDVGSGGTFPVAVIKSANRSRGPVNGTGFPRNVVDTVRQRRGSSKCIRTKAIAELRLCSKGDAYRERGRTNVHYEFEYCDPGLLLSGPEQLKRFIGTITPDACCQGCTLRLDVLTIGLRNRGNGVWCSWGEDRAGPTCRAQK